MHVKQRHQILTYGIFIALLLVVAFNLAVNIGDGLWNIIPPFDAESALYERFWVNSEFAQYGIAIDSQSAVDRSSLSWLSELAFFLLLHIYGLLLVLPLKRSVPIWLLSFSGILWGGLAWCAVAMIMLLLSISYTAATTIIGLGLLLIPSLYSWFKEDTTLSSNDL